MKITELIRQLENVRANGYDEVIVWHGKFNGGWPVVNSEVKVTSYHNRPTVMLFAAGDEVPMPSPLDGMEPEDVSKAVLRFARSLRDAVDVLYDAHDKAVIRRRRYDAEAADRAMARSKPAQPSA